MDRIEVCVSEELNREFPRNALSRLDIEDFNGNRYASGIHQAKGDYDYPLSSTEKKQKFASLVAPLLGVEKCDELYQSIQQVETLKNIRDLTKGCFFKV